MAELDADGIEQFDRAIEQMQPLLDDLLAAPKHTVADHPKVPSVAGVYLFSEDDRPIYVGQSRKLSRRLRFHTSLTSRENQASFAFNIAKREAGKVGLNIKPLRKALEADPDFAEHFSQAKERVRAMEVQFIGLEDPINRTIFEVYASLALKTNRGVWTPAARRAGVSEPPTRCATRTLRFAAGRARRSPN